MRLGLLLISTFAILFPPPEHTSPTVSSLVHRFESAYRSSKTLQANFLETYFDSGKVVRSEAGVAYFAKPGKMRWEYESPEPNLYLVDGKWSWFYVPADHTVTRTRAKQSSDSRTPLALLAGEMKVSRLCKTVILDRSSRSIDAQGVVLRCHLRGSDESVPPTPDSAPAAHGSCAVFAGNQTSGEHLRLVGVYSGDLQG